MEFSSECWSGYVSFSRDLLPSWGSNRWSPRTRNELTWRHKRGQVEVGSGEAQTPVVAERSHVSRNVHLFAKRCIMVWVWIMTGQPIFKEKMLPWFFDQEPWVSLLTTQYLATLLLSSLPSFLFFFFIKFLPLFFCYFPSLLLSFFPASSSLFSYFFLPLFASMLNWDRRGVLCLLECYLL